VALSSTGAGEYFIRHGATRDIAARVEYLHMSLKDATDAVIKGLIGKEDGARGAVIAISSSGDVVVSSTGYGVLHGYATQSVLPTVAVKSD
jgi:beta-aspartyl-peptidase (threonine type)